MSLRPELHFYCYASCRYRECRDADCRGAQEKGERYQKHALQYNGSFLSEMHHKFCCNWAKLIKLFVQFTFSRNKLECSTLENFYCLVL